MGNVIKNPVFSLWMSAVMVVLLAGQSGAAGEPLLALFNLRPLSLDALGYDGEILYSIVSGLDKKDSVRLIPRREMEDQLSRAELSQSDNLGTVLRAGKILGVDFILAGQVDKKGNRIIASFKLVDIDRKKVAKTWKESFDGHSEIVSKGGRIADVIMKGIRGSSRAGAVQASEEEPRAKTIDIHGFKAVGNGELVELHWTFDTSDPIAQFHIYRSQDSRGPFQCIGSSKKNSFVDSFARKNKTYYYSLGATLHDGKTIEFKQKAKISDVGQKLPHPPLVVTQTGHVQRVKIKCIPSMLNSREKFSIKEYRLYRKQDTDQDWVLRQTFPIAKRSQRELAFYIEDADLDDATPYTYVVTSVSKKGKESPYSEEAVVTTLSRPELELTGDHMLRKAELRWSTVPDVEGYYLYRRHGDTDWEKIARLRSGTTSHLDDDDLEDGLNYTYAVTAYDSLGETRKSDPVTAATKPLPDPPTGLEAQSGQVKSVSLGWNPLQDEDVGGYVVYRGLNRSDLQEIVRVKGHGTKNYVDKGSYFEPIKDGTTYYYSIAAFNTFKAVGPPALAVQATTKPVPGKPRHFGIQMDQGRVVLTWQKNSETDIQVYRIMRSHNHGGWSRLAEVDAGETSFVDTELRPDTSYAYQLIAIDKDGLESSPAVSKTVQTPPEQ